MLHSRAFIARLALFLLLLVASTATLGRLSYALSSSNGRDANVSECERGAGSEREDPDLELAEPPLRSPIRNMRTPRPAPLPTSELPHFTLVADLRPVRAFSPVPRPPIRHPPIRLLN